MTNEEAIKSMRNLDDIISITESEHESVKTAISALEHNSLLIEHISNLQNENTDFFNKLVKSDQENTKLKTEINRLNGKSKMYRGIADDFCNSNIKLKAEIEQLKSELEQSVKLQKTDEESEKERIIIWLNDFCDKFAKCNQCIFNGRCKEFDEMDFDEIKSQYEEAEQSLKGQV